MFFSQRFFARGIFALAVVPCLFAALLFTGCKQEPEPGIVSLNGKWVSLYGEVFIIDFSDMSYSSPADGEYGDYSVEGDIKGIVYFNSEYSAGIIYYEITSKGDSFEVDGSGDFTGIYFEYLNYKTVSFSNAANASYRTPVYSNLNDAKNALNVNSLGDYFAMGSACTKE